MAGKARIFSSPIRGALDDDSALPLLCLRAAVIAPDEEAAHRELISYLVEQKRELELVRHIATLSRAGEGGARWLSEL